MRKVGRAILVLCALSGSVQTFAGDDQGGDKEAARAPRGYSSPQEAFQARRTTIAKRDWRTAFSSMTPEIRDQAVEEIGLLWIWLESDAETPWDSLGGAVREVKIARYRTIMKKHGLELQKFQAEYKKRYRESHGVDLDKILAERRKREMEQFEAYLKEHPEDREEGEKLLKEHPEYFGGRVTVPRAGEKPVPDLPESDMELEAKVILSQVIDKAGLYEEATEFSTPKVMDPEWEDDIFGDLQGVTVSGDTARGWVVWTGYVHVDGVKKANKPERALRRFRRLNGGWYNDNREGDHTRYDDP